MANTIQFTVAPAAEYPGKWIARMFYARKVEGYSFGTFGVKTKLLGVFPTKELAQGAVEAKKATLHTPKAAA